MYHPRVYLHLRVITRDDGENYLLETTKREREGHVVKNCSPRGIILLSPLRETKGLKTLLRVLAERSSDTGGDERERPVFFRGS